MVDDKYKLKDKSKAELRAWVAEQTHGTDKYNAGIEESMRRVAAIEELMEKKEAPVWRRELIALGIAVLAIVAAIAAIVRMYQY